MKKTLRLKFMLLLFALVVGYSSAFGQTTATLQITSSVTSTGNLTDSHSNIWAFNTDGTLTGNTTYIQAGTNKSPVTYITLEASAFSSKKITRVQVWGTSKANTDVSAKVIIGSTTIGTSPVYTTQNASSGGTEFSVNNTDEVAGNLKIEISRPSSANGAIYFNKAIVTYLEPHTITFIGNGGTYNSESSYSQIVFDGEATNLTANQFTYADHNFLGWKDANDIDYTDGQSVSLTADLVLTAQWEAIGTDPYITASDVNVAYTATEGNISYTVNNYQSGTMTATTTADWLTIGTVTGPHATEHTGTVPFTMNANTGAQRSATVTLSYDFGGIEPATKQVTVTQAVAQYSVTYQANGGSGSNVVKTYDYGTNVTILAYNDPAINFTAPSEKFFKNWKDGNNTTYNSGETIHSIAANYTLSAQWEAFPKYYLVTNTNQIVAGKHYVIANSGVETENAYGIGAPNGTFRDRATISVSKDSNNNCYITKTEELYDFVLSGKDNLNKWTLYDKKTGVYLYGGSKGTLGGNDGSDGIPATAKFLLALTEDGNIVFNNNDFIIEYNASASRFASYAGTMADVYLYVKENDEDIETYSDIMLSNNWTVTGDLTIQSGIVTIPNTKTLSVTGKFNNSTAANLIIEDGGQLICNNAVEVTAQKSIDKASNWGIETSYTPDAWYFIASPINSSLTPATAGLITGDFDLYRYDATNEVSDVIKPWVNYQAHTEGFTLTNGQGYLYANAANQTLEFAGPIKPYSTSDNTVTLTRDGWNLIGNPYTFAVNVDKAFNEVNKASAPTSRTANSTINPCVGIAVYGSNGDVVTFTKPTELSSAPSSNNIQMVLAQTVATRGGKNMETIDNAIVSFNEGSELPKFYFGTQNANLYIPMDNEEFAIVSSNGQGEMPVNFRAYVAGEYTITVNPEEVEMGYLHLIDNIAGKDVDLLANPSYSFNARTDDYESRFRLVFSTTMVNAEMGEDFAFFSNGQLVIANEGEATLQVIDVTGRVVATENINGTCSKAINAKAGVYVLRLINGTDVKTQKMVIR